MLTSGNGTIQTFEYDNRYRIKRNFAAGRFDHRYEYGPGENIMAIRDEMDHGYDRTFDYDELDRLVTANTGFIDPEQGPETVWRTPLWGPGGYQYDSMGNLKRLQLGQGGAIGREAALTYQGTTPRIATVSTVPRVEDTEGQGGKYGTINAAVSYDAAGNELVYGASRTYSARNLLSSIEEFVEPVAEGFAESHRASYEYDGRGIRLVRSEGAGPVGISLNKRHYTYSQGLQLLSSTDDDVMTARYDIIWLGDRPVAQINYVPTATTRHTFADHLGTPFLQMIGAEVVWQAEYEPFGEIADMRIGSRGDQPLRFPGQDSAGTWDGTEENYNIFRWYRTGWGRYTQSDPIGLSGGLNLFGYVAQNPTGWADPLGLYRTGDVIYRCPPAGQMGACDVVRVAWDPTPDINSDGNEVVWAYGPRGRCPSTNCNGRPLLTERNGPRDYYSGYRPTGWWRPSSPRSFDDYNGVASDFPEWSQDGEQCYNLVNEQEPWNLLWPRNLDFPYGYRDLRFWRDRTTRSSTPFGWWWRLVPRS